jgi:hypothetical protein
VLPVKYGLNLHILYRRNRVNRREILAYDQLQVLQPRSCGV